VDADYIISLVAFAIVALNGGSLIFLLSIRDKLRALTKKIEGQTQRIARLSEWLEGQTKTKRKSKNDDPNAKT
jgi:hypothetical protein